MIVYTVKKIDDDSTIGQFNRSKDAKRFSLNVFNETGVRSYVVNIKGNIIFQT